MVLDLLDSVLKAADAEAKALPENLDATIAKTAACQMAGEVASTLAGVRRAVGEESARILRDQANDPAVANDAANVIEAFGKDRDRWAEAITDSVLRARGLGAFVGAWVNTARLTFPNVYVFGTNTERGSGGRETFVVVASRKPLDLADLGKRPGDPEFYLSGRRHQPQPYPESDMRGLEIRSRGIVLTDDYAPVENLLAPVAETRGD